MSLLSFVIGMVSGALLFIIVAFLCLEETLSACLDAVKELLEIKLRTYEKISAMKAVMKDRDDRSN